MLLRFPIFDSENDENDELSRLMTSDVAPENIKSALLTANGEQRRSESLLTHGCAGRKSGFMTHRNSKKVPGK